jgi:hypothetical protein
VDITPGLARNLAELGVEVGTQLFPRFSADGLRSFPLASLVVANAWAYVDALFADLLADAGLPVASLALPYGVDGTLQWLRAIRAELAMPPGDTDPAWSYLDQARSALSAFRQRWTGSRIAVVARAENAVDVLSPRRRFGVPLLELFEALGLCIDLHLFSPPGADRRVVEPHELGLDAAKGHRVLTFYHWRELSDVLATSTARVVYTETYRDERVTSAGKVPITPRMLEPGFDGLCRTLRRLGCALALPFFERWQHHFDDPHRHLRLTP